MSKTYDIPRILITAPASGSGKTLFTCGLMQAFLNRRLDIRGCKCGPDYIDPMFHRKALGIPSRNLDSFFMDADGLKRTLAAGRQAELTIMEGVMGHYDGLGGFQTEGSSYDIAVKTGTPSVLLLPCRGMSLSAAAVLSGMLHYKKDSMIQGVVFNRISPKIYQALKDAMERDPNISVKVLGYLPERNDLHLESRHLGLVTPDEMKDFKKQLWILAEQMEKTVDLDGILSLAQNAEPIPVPDMPYDLSIYGADAPMKQHSSQSRKLPPPPLTAPNIAVAHDGAFCFYYEETLEMLRLLGANLCFFSPCHDRHLPEHVHGLYLGGGYPELYLKSLSENPSLRMEIHDKLLAGLPCMAECGGFMYLHDSIQDNEGNSYPMCGVIHETCFPKKGLGHFGYAVLTAQRDTAFLKKGERILCHEFHYWESTNDGDTFLAKKPTGNKSWKCIHSTGNLLAGYPHFSFSSNPKLLKNFIKAAVKYRKEVTQRFAL